MQDVRDVHPRPNGGVPGNGPPHTSGAMFAPTNGIEIATAVADREPHPGEQVVHQRVAEVALEQREHEHRQADAVGEVARLAERAGEEDAQHVQHDRGDEDVGRPVVRLAHQQARP